MKSACLNLLACLALAALLGTLVACQADRPIPSPVAVSPAAAPLSPAAPSPTQTFSSPAAPTPPPSTPDPVTPPASSPETDWDERSVFRAGLIRAEQSVLDGLPGASVYHLDVQISQDLARLSGRQSVRYTNRESAPLDVLYFRLFPNLAGGAARVSGLQVDGQSAQPVYELEDSAMRVPLPAPLPPGAAAVVEMDFQVQVPRDLGGNYGLFGYFEDVLVLDRFYPVIPAYDAAGWNVEIAPPYADAGYLDASFYLVRVTAPATLTLVASGVEMERQDGSGRQVVTFAAGPARDFYLAASQRYTVVSESLGETRVNSYALAGHADAAQQALRNAVDALQSFNARFGPYPYTEFDVAATPMQALGIEYPGLAGIVLTLYDPQGQVAGLPSPVLLESVVAHEVAHQWFYNAVGNDQVDEPWLDEAAAQYVTMLYYADTYGEQGAAAYRASWAQRWERVGRAEIPIGLPTGSYTPEEYGAIVYGRGPLFLDALAGELGQAQFDRFLRDYYRLHQWGIATRAEFQQLAETDCNCDLAPLFEEWVDAK